MLNLTMLRSKASIVAHPHSLCCWMHLHASALSEPVMQEQSGCMLQTMQLSDTTQESQTGRADQQCACILAAVCTLAIKSHCL